MPSPINRVMIIGSGWVGRQIAARLATFGITVGLTDKDADTIEDAVQWIANIRSAANQPLSVGMPNDADMKVNILGDDDLELNPERVAKNEQTSPQSPPSTSLDITLVEKHEPFHQLTRDQVLAWRPELVIECVPEQISLKKRVLRRICELVPKDCIIVSNSSYFVPSILSQFVECPERFAHLHFHVPVLRDSVADIVGCHTTSGAVLQRLTELCQRIGQHPLLLKREHPGYVFNWLLQSVLKAALELAALDVAEIEDIDRSWKSVTGMSVGPFGMMDQIGIDVIDQVLSNARWAESSPVNTQQLLAVLRPLIEQGRLGTKSNAGFYDY